MKVKTRDRILQTSLTLFNALGEPNVTTLLISDELDISPGNLYYHFKSKGDIVGELFDAFEDEMLDLITVPDDVDISLEQHGFFLHLLFEAIARYRFIYQDLVNILSRYDRLQGRFRKLLKKKDRAFRTICDSLHRQGLMTTNAQELDALCQQLTLTACYWISYDSLSHLQDRDDVDPARGVFQMLHVLAPYLNDEARADIETMSRDYL